MPTAIDHLLFAGPDLVTLTSMLERLSGVAPISGGRHEGLGTHNALLGLEGDRYLELISPDPTSPEGAFAAAIDYLDEPALHTYCARVSDLGALCNRAQALGLEAIQVPGSRVQPNGNLLEWSLAFITGHPYGGHFPFFIDWHGSTHPSSVLPAALSLKTLWLEHPDAAGLSELLRDVAGFSPSSNPELGELRPLASNEPRLRADFTGPHGYFSIGGVGAPMRG